MSNYNCIVIEDDNTSRFLLCDLLKKSGKFEIIKDFGNPVEGLRFLSEHFVDVIFLDVEMPEMSGIDLAKLVTNGEKIVITTSKEEYAIDAFGVRAFDFILKPVSLAKLLMLAEHLSVNNSDATSNKPIFLRTKNGYVKMRLDEVSHVQAFGDYLNYFTKSDKYTVRQSMNEAKETLCDLNFAQVHRSYIVILDYIDSFESDSLMIGNEKIPISRGFKDSFLSQIKKLV